MNTDSKLTIHILTLILCFSAHVAVSNTARQATPSLQPSPPARLNATPRGFIPNVGQLPDAAAKFALRDRGVTAFFREQGFVLWTGQATTRQDGREVKMPVAPRWELVGANPVEPVGGEMFAHTVSFFRGNDPAKWRANVPAYRDLRYPEILQGVELRVESREAGFEYSFHVRPRAKANLRFRYHGITGLEKSVTGGLIVRTATGQFTESRPVAFQWIDGAKRDVESSFEIVSTNEYRIAVGAYDERHELVIDPVLDWSTSVGGSNNDHLTVVKVDPTGDVVVAGLSYSINLPTTPGFAPFGTAAGEKVGTNQWPETDVYIAKLSADGTQLRWAGYLGGEGATSDAIGRNKSLAIDPAGDVYVTTHTRSPDFPVLPVGNSTHQGEADVSITKIKGDGSAILWSRLLGASAEDYGFAVSVHANDLYLSGITASPNFPVTARTFQGMQDAFVAKLNAADGAIAWASFLGGSLEDRVAAIVADGGGVIVYGNTDSGDFHAPDFPAPAIGHDRALGGTNDAFLTKLGPSGEILWSTYLGGSHNETAFPTPFPPFTLLYAWTDVALDTSGNIVAVGLTSSADFPNTTGRFQPALAGTRDAYVAKFTPDGSLLWASYLGGSAGGSGESAGSVAINPWDEIFISGWTYTTSPSFPTTPDALKRVTQTEEFLDGFLTKINRDGTQILYSTLIGNTGWDDAILGMDYGFGKVVVGGWHLDTFVPITQGAFQQNCNNCGSETALLSFLDAFVAHDGFESGNYSGGIGWARNWTNSGDVSILTSSAPHSGGRHVRLRSGTGYLQRTANISPSSTTLRLGFWAKVNSFESSDRADVLVRSTAANFTTVASLTAAQSDNNYHFYEIDLTPFLPASQIHIAFDAAMSANNDDLFLDDIRLTGTSDPLPPVANAGPDQTVTDTDNSGAEVVTLNGAGSFDPDGGNIASYEWKEGATVLGASASISPSLSVGVHTITLTVTDDEGAIASDTIQVTVNAPPPPPPNPLHVGDLDGASATSGKNNWKATIVVTIHNGNHGPVPNATVFIQWGGGASGTASLITDANGRCTFVSGNIGKTSSTATLTVTSVSHATLTYSSAANHDPEGDSNGTSITVIRP